MSNGQIILVTLSTGNYSYWTESYLVDINLLPECAYKEAIIESCTANSRVNLNAYNVNGFDYANVNPPCFVSGKADLFFDSGIKEPFVSDPVGKWIEENEQKIINLRVQFGDVYIAVSLKTGEIVFKSNDDSAFGDWLRKEGRKVSEYFVIHTSILGA